MLPSTGPAIALLIRHNNVQWARSWSLAEIEAGREQDRRRKEDYFSETAPAARTGTRTNPKKNRWQQLKEPLGEDHREFMVTEVILESPRKRGIGGVPAADAVSIRDIQTLDTTI